MPVKTTPTGQSKLAVPANEGASVALHDRVSFGMLSLLVGCVALSFHSIPFLLVRILAVLLGLAGITLAVLQFRTKEKAGRNFNSAVAGTLFSAAVILLTAIGPYLPAPSARGSRAPARPSAPAAVQAEAPTKNAEPASPQPQSEATAVVAEQPAEVVEIPSYVPKVIPFPCRKTFMLMPSGSPEWVDAPSAAVLHGEAGVCIPKVTIEKLEVHPENKSTWAKDKQMVVHIQVSLIGSRQLVNFENWGESNFGETRHKPTLTDNSNHVYQLRSFEPGTEVVGHKRSASLYPKLYGDDELIFEPPAPNIEYLRLELPASAFGGMGTLRFQIPKVMIEGMADLPSTK